MRLFCDNVHFVISPDKALHDPPMQLSTLLVCRDRIPILVESVPNHDGISAVDFSLHRIPGYCPVVVAKFA